MCKERGAAMVTSQKPTGLAKSFPVGIAIGWLGALLVMGIGTAVSTFLVLGGGVAWESIGYSIIAILLLSSFTGSVIACRQIKRRFLLVGAVEALAYYLTVLICAVLFFGGKGESALVTALLVAGGSFTAVLLCGGRTEGRKKRKRRKLHF